LLHRAHLTGEASDWEGFAGNSVNNTSKPGRCGVGRSRAPTGFNDPVCPTKWIRMGRDEKRAI
jgi:hypothetical protein